MPIAKQSATAITAGVGGTAAPNAFQFGEITRLNDIANAFGAFFLGGSRDDGIDGTGVQDISHYIDIRLDGTLLAGYTIIARVEVMTPNAGTSIEPRIYDVTTVGAPVLFTTTGGSASTSTTWARQALTFDTLPLAVKYYRLRVNKSNATYTPFCIGYLEFSLP